MAETYWDPGNLLQITFDEGEDAGFACVGRAHQAYGSRCRWSIEDPNRATAHRLLRELAYTMPSEVSASQLHALAAACLCRQFHSNQRNEPVNRWIGVVARAAQQCDDLTNGWRERLNRAQWLIAMHQLRISTLENEASELQEEKHSLQEQLRAINETLEVLQKKIDDSGRKVESLRTENQNLQTDNNSLLEDLRSARRGEKCPGRRDPTTSLADREPGRTAAASRF